MTTISIEMPQPKTMNAEPPGAEPEVNGFSFELKAKTPPGEYLVALAEEKAAEMSRCAGEHDRDGTYPFEAIESLKNVNYFAAPIPDELGGLGVESIHDILVASSRMARGDASVAIGVNMHMATVANLARAWRVARFTGNRKVEGAMGQMLEFIARGRLTIAAATSELNQDLTRPQTRAERQDDGSWVINGKKIFGTMSPAADSIIISVTYANAGGDERFAFVFVPKDTPGVILNDDWDALGMRASGSQSITFESVRVPPHLVTGGFPAGILTPQLLERFLTAGPLHASASLGIAEAAHHIAVTSAASKLAKGGATNAHTTMTAAQNAIELSAMRAIFGRAGELIDAYNAAHPAGDGDLDSKVALFSEVQAAKAFINEAAPRVVDRALSLTGGAGFANKHPLSRLYRDVRAGAFMHPLGANRAYDFIGAAALGLEPSIK